MIVKYVIKKGTISRKRDKEKIVNLLSKSDEVIDTIEDNSGNLNIMLKAPDSQKVAILDMRIQDIVSQNIEDLRKYVYEVTQY